MKFVINVLWFSLMLLLPLMSQDNSRPQWANATFIPANTNDIFYAIQHGYMKRNAKAEYYDRCMADISRQIESYVENEIVSVELTKRANKDFSIRQRIENTVKVTSSAKFFGEDFQKREYVDQESKTYWIFLSLEKSVYRQRIEQRIIAARQKAQSAFRSGLDAETGARFVPAVQHYRDALEAVKDFSASRLLECEIEGKVQNVTIPIVARLRGIFGETEIAAIHNEATFKAAEAKSIEFSLAINRNNTLSPINALPVAFSVYQGQASIDQQGLSNADGNARTIIKSAKWSSKGIRIKARPFWESFFSESGLQEIFNLKIDTSRYALSTAHLAAPKVLLVSRVDPNSSINNINLNSLTGMISKHLTTTVNAQVIKATAEADYKIEVIVSVEPLGQANDLYSVENTLLFRLISMKGEKEIFASEAKSRGLGLSNVQAFNTSLKRLKLTKILTEVDKFLVL